MAYTHGTISAGSYGAHKELVAAIATAAVAAGWTVMRQTAGTDSVEAEVILHSTGYSGTEDIYVGFKTYSDIYNRYYFNVNVGVFTGYSAGSDFSAQPGAIRRGIPVGREAFEYHFVINPQRVGFALCMYGSAWQTCCAGYGIRHCLPSEYPRPLMIAGMFDADRGESIYGNSYSWSQLVVPDSLGFNRDPACRTVADDNWSNAQSLASHAQFVNSCNLDNDQKFIRPIHLCNVNAAYFFMEVDGFYHTPTFEAVPGSKVVIGGVDYLIVPNGSRGAFGLGQTVAMRLD